MSNTNAPPAPVATVDQTPAVPTVVQLVPAPAAEPDEQTPNPRTARSRGVPIEPLAIGAGNGTAMAVTAAYQAAGPLGLVAAGATVAAVGAGAILARRRAVRGRTSTAAGRSRLGASGTGAGRSRGGAASGAGRGASGGGGSSGRGVSPRAGLGARGGAAPRTPGRGRGGSALGSSGRRGAGRLSGLGNKSPKHPKHKRPRDGGGASPSSSSTRTRTPRARSPLGMLRPAASAARRGMTGMGRGIAKTGRGIAKAGRGIAKTGRGIASGARKIGHGVGSAGRAVGTAGRWVRDKTRAMRRAAARRTGRILGSLWDGAMSALRGAASAVWNWSVRSGLAKARAVWNRRRKARAAKRTAGGPTMTGPIVATSPAPIATTVRRPASAGGSPSTLGASVSGGHHFLAPAMELARIATTYTPEGMMQVGRDFGALPDALEHIANAMKISTARADAEQPLDPRVVEIMQQIYGLQMKASELARELKPAFLKLHGVDINRIQNPRKGRQAESKWDVTRNADTSV